MLKIQTDFAGHITIIEKFSRGFEEFIRYGSPRPPKPPDPSIPPSILTEYTSPP